VWGLIVVVVLLAGCGVAPEFTYVTDAGDRTYAKVPRTWQPIDQHALKGAFGLDPAFSAADQGYWLAGFDADPAPAIAHLTGVDATMPTVLMAVKTNPASAQGQFSLDKMRDLFFPVSPAGRQAAAADPSATALSGFTLFTDQVLTPGNSVHGVHDVYRYSFAGGPPQMLDQTIYVNDDASKVYMFLVRCSTECYMQRQKEISTVVSSFTVREIR
jgi:hypothetical protein